MWPELRNLVQLRTLPVSSLVLCNEVVTGYIARAALSSMDSTASEMGMMGALRTGNMVFDMIIAMMVPYIFKLLMDLANGQVSSTTPPHAPSHAP